MSPSVLRMGLQRCLPVGSLPINSKDVQRVCESRAWEMRLKVDQRTSQVSLPFVQLYGARSIPSSRPEV